MRAIFRQIKIWSERYAGGMSGPQRSIVAAASSYRDFPEKALTGGVWDRFTMVAKTHAERPAVQGATSQWSYRQLWRKATAVAAAVQTADASSQQPVALLLRHDLKMIGAILGVVKTGRPYVFLDPSLPEDRLRFLFTDSKASVLIYHPEYAALAQNLAVAGQHLLELETALQTTGGDPLVSLGGPQTPLCLNYTSGTTGTPSGVLRTHRALLANIRNMTNLAKISPDDRMILAISPASGAAAMDIFGAILNGACVVPFNVRSRGVPRLVAWMVEQKVTFYHSVPTLFRSLCSVMETGLKMPDLRFVLLGGEAVFRSDLEAFQRFFPQAVLQNVLGMTEGAGILCSYLANHQTVLDGERVPVGYPVAGKVVKILDAQGQELPVGEAGEIAIESEFLATGYWGQQERTSERFKALGSEGNKRLLTRDLGRLRQEDGALEWLGRMDSQLKVGGLRVSPTEVESVLRKDPAVRDAVVTLAKLPEAMGQSRETQLLAWIIQQTGLMADPETLRLLVRSQLPPEAVPARFLVLKEFPLLPNGKVDRKILNFEHPAAIQLSASMISCAPRNEMERVVLKAWEHSLGVTITSVYVDFFELGGDSLSAVNVLADLSSHFGFELPGHALLHYPILASLAETIPVWRAQRSGRKSFGSPQTPLETPAIVKLKSEGSAPPLYILPGGHGREMELFVFARMLTRMSAARPAFGLRISSLFDEFPNLKSLGEVATRMIHFLSAEPPKGPWILLGECAAGLLAVEMARQLYLEHPAIAPSKVILLDVRTNAHLGDVGFQLEAKDIPRELSHYFDLLFTWEPHPFDFPLELIISDGFRAQSPDPTLGWHRYTDAKINTRTVPGDHTTYIRHHVEHVALAVEVALG